MNGHSSYKRNSNFASICIVFLNAAIFSYKL